MKEAGADAFLSGREFTADEVAQVCETVRVCSALPWFEIVQTVCEHLGWVTPAGRYKVASCAKALAVLERRGLLTLPAKRVRPCGPQQVVMGADTDAEALVTGTVREIGPVAVVPVTETGEMRRWNGYVARYHPQGYQRPFGAHQRYFVMGAGERRLGCLLFAASAWALAARDRWIGWTARDRAQRLNWVVANTRFVLFPWVQVKNLASTALARVARRIRADWQARYGYGPVLLETFVDPARFRGTCYQAANWIRVGETTGRGRMDRETRYLSTPRVIYVYPLVPGWRSVLRGERDESISPGRGGVAGGSRPGAATSAAPAGRAGVDAAGDGHAGQQRQSVEDRGGGARGAAHRG